MGTFINRLGGFLQVFVVLYMIDQGFSNAQAAIALTAYSAGSIIGMLLGGGFSDVFGGQRTIIASMACSAVLSLAVFYVDPYVAKIVVITLAGALSQAYRPAATSLLSDLVPNTRHVMVFAMNRLAINLGTTALPLLGIVLTSVSYGLLFWAEAVAAGAYAVIAALALPPLQPATPRRRKSDTAEKTHQPYSFRILLGDHRYLLFLGGMLVHSVIYVQFLAILPLSIHHRHMPTLVYAALISLNGLAVITCELLVTKIVQRRSPHFAVVSGMALTALGMSFYAPQWGIAGLVFATLVWTLGEMAGAPTIYFAYPAQAAPRELRGQYLGAANAMYGLGNAIGPVIGVLAWNQLGEQVWWLCGAAGLLAIATVRNGIKHS
jgi:MFS family permease